MNTGTIRQQLQNYLEIADEKKVKAIYVMMESEIKDANDEFMSYNYQFHDIAQDEYETSVQWYSEKSEKAALGFVNAVDIALIKICNYPLRYRNTKEKYSMITK